VQGEIERALAALCAQEVRIALAGRTDAGVHATGQVISFRAATELGATDMRRGVNALLPADIAVKELSQAGEDFHARFSATGRTYEYRIRNAPQREPLERHREHWMPQALDAEALRLAAGRLPGRRDLSAFASGPGGVRTIRRAEWSREAALLRFEIEADGFLRGMVRAIVGTLLWVGRGKITPDALEGIVASGDRSRAGPSAPAAGLCLVAVAYEGNARAKEEDGEE